MKKLMCTLAAIAAGVVPAVASAETCPKDDALLSFLARSWKVDKTKVTGAVCTAGKFPAAGYLVHANVAGKDWGAFQRTAFLDASGKTLAQSDSEVTSERANDYVQTMALQAIDLDGDGTDEVVAAVVEAPKLSPATTNVHLIRLQGGKVSEAQVAMVDYTTADGAQVCEGTFQVSDKRVVVHSKLVGKKDLATKANVDCTKAAGTYTLGAKGMVKQ